MKQRSKKTISFITYQRIEEALKTDLSYSQIAKEYKVSKSSVCRIYQKAYKRYMEQQHDNQE
jgi:DNA-directed RNA polymerase specialized sigma subunit